MSNEESLLGIVQDFHKKIDGCFEDLREHIDDTAKDLKQSNDQRYEKLEMRVNSVETRQDKQDGAWKLASVVASIVAIVIGWLISLFGKH